MASLFTIPANLDELNRCNVIQNKFIKFYHYYVMIMINQRVFHIITDMQGIGWWFDRWINIAIHSPHPPLWSVLFPFCRNDCYSIPFRVVSVLFAYDWCADRRINLPPTWWDHIIWIGCWYGHLVVIRIIYYHLAVNITKSMLPRDGKQKLKRWVSIKK